MMKKVPCVKVFPFSHQTLTWQIITFTFSLGNPLVKQSSYYNNKIEASTSSNLDERQIIIDLFENVKNLEVQLFYPSIQSGYSLVKS